ncbi:MAG TPA: carbonic anhydrase [Polyangiales bacterium]|nr:carbonic anhydrase [Polyangiales bacterium]
MSSLLNKVLQHNANWVSERNRPLSKAPQKRVVIFTCMDTRLVDFLEPALGLRRGDAQMIKNAGNTLVDPGGGVVRSLVMAIHAMMCEEVLVIGHKDCGMAQIDSDKLRRNMIERGVPESAIDALHPSLPEWVGGFHDPLGNVERVVGLLRDNPLIPRSVPIHGLMFDPGSGVLNLLVDGYAAAGRVSDVPRPRV